MENLEWVIISYTLPREPSRIRVHLWRKLKKIGAANIQQSLWMLPLTEENDNTLSDIKDEVSQNNGEAFVMKCFTDEDTSIRIISRFNESRDEEYTELIEQCEAYFREIDKETARKNFSFAEIEENEEELLKLKQWFIKIMARDTFKAPLREKGELILAKCADLLNEFCDKVYEYTENR